MNPADSIGNVAILHHNGDPRQRWSLHEIDRLPTSHRLRWANIDSGGERVLINAPLVGANAHAPDYRGHVPLVYYRPGDWKRNVVSDAEEGILHGIYVTDWLGEGRDELLIGSLLGVHLYRYQPNGGWSRTKITTGDPDAWPKSGTSDIAVGRLKGERFLAAIEPWQSGVFTAYSDLTIAEVYEPMVGNRDTMCVAGQIMKNVLRATERRLGVHDPILAE
jgi:hypothetical protein